MSSRKAVRCIRALQMLQKLKRIKDEEEPQKRKRFWVNPYLELRQQHDIEAHLLKDILWESGNDFHNFCRMDIHKFEEILGLVASKIERTDTVLRAAIHARVRLAVTLRYIATGDSYRSLEFLSHISRKTVSSFVPEVLQAIIDALEGQHLKTPSTANEWHKIANDFQSLWQFPHTLGAIDGKHIRIKAPPNSGSDFYNYKNYFSIVLLGVVDAHSRFIYIDVGANGRASDVVVLKNCSLYAAMTGGLLNIPESTPLKGQIVPTPYYFIGDDIFGLDRHLLKAYNRNANLSVQQEAFNYRLSRARMTVEMAFGRLKARFRIFHRPIETSMGTTDLIVKACCILHNYLTTDKLETPPIAGRDGFSYELPATMSSLPKQEYDNYKYACQIRDNVLKYCVTEGDIPLQWSKIKKQTL